MTKIKKIRIRFEFTSPESTEYTQRSFKAQLRDTIQDKTHIKMNQDFDGVAVIKTNRSKKEILEILRSDDYLSEFTFR